MPRRLAHRLPRHLPLHRPPRCLPLHQVLRGRLPTRRLPSRLSPGHR
ncbi:hypothetical protein [Actinoplanes regularis]|nr:hypothetical protein [Actinoplanes regularis]